MDTLRFITCGSVDDGKSTLIGRLLTSSALSLDESMLSGESIPVYKSSDNEEPTEHATVAFQGTLVLKGRAKAIVVATGANTKLGQLGHSLTEIQSKATPLQDDLEKLGRPARGSSLNQPRPRQQSSPSSPGSRSAGGRPGGRGAVGGGKGPLNFLYSRLDHPLPGHTGRAPGHRRPAPVYRGALCF